jgi:2-oxoisovalerate dehydrogenase E1 component
MRVVGLHWLMPLPIDDMVGEADATGQVLVVDEIRHGGGVGEGIVTALVEYGFGGRIMRVATFRWVAPPGLGCLARTTSTRGPPAAELTDRALVTR